MAFILDAQREDPDFWNRYRAYLESVLEAFPPGAVALATSDWWSTNSQGRWIIEASDVEHRWLRNAVAH